MMSLNPSISTCSSAWCSLSGNGVVTPPRRKRIEIDNYVQSAIELERGTEMGRFNMGSTVILLFAKNSIQWNQDLAAEQPLLMGQAIGSVTSAK